jgi:hypothetical protein
MYKDHKIIATTFAGRQDRMFLLVNYILKALELGIIDEYHIWDFSKNNNDKNWLSALPSLHPNIKLFTNHHFEGGKRLDNQWKPYYKFYTIENFSEQTVILKMDDDIVYIDIDKLQDFIDFRISNPQYFIVSANVINNGVTAGLQQEYGAIPVDICPPTGFKYETFCGRLWNSGKLAESLHSYFIKNKSSFIKDGIFVQPVGDRISINFISWLGKDFMYTENCFADDELNLSVTLPKKLNRNNCVYFPLLVSHLSFYQQTRQINEKIIIEEYKNLQKKELNNAN